MKNWYMRVVMCALLGVSIQVGAQEASYEILYDVRSVKVSVVSNNGEWIGCGSQGVAFYYNTLTGKAKTMTDPEHPGMSVVAISNSGMLLGSYGKNSSSPAAYYRNNKWTFLPVLEGRESKASQAAAISEDETIIGGWIDGNRGSGKESILPLIWKLTGDEYRLDTLPQPEKDITGELPQGSCVRNMSADGSVIVGDFLNKDGAKRLPIIWTKKEDGEYTYRIWGEELVYNLQAQNPGIFPNYYEYVTAEGGTPEYEEQYALWEKLLEEYVEKRSAFYKGKGIFELRNIAVSGNGRWVVVAWQEDEKKGLQAYRIDLQNNVAVLYNGDYNTCPRAVLDDGTVIAFSGFNGYIWTGQVYKDEENGQKPLYEWIKEEMNVDISEDFLFTIPYEDPVTGAINEVDSVVTGCCTISKDGSTVISYLADPDSYSRIINYYVRKEPTGIASMSMPENVSVYVHENVLYVNGEVKGFTILDLAGKEVYQTRTGEKEISVGFLPRGIYLVRFTTVSGQTEVSKIFVL